MTRDIEASSNSLLVGIGWMVVTTFFFVGVTAIARHVGTALPAAESAFIRYLIGTLMVLPFLRPFLRNPPTRRVMGLYALRGFFHGLGVILWFYAMARIPMAEVTALGYVSPIFVTIGAAIFLGERLYTRRIMAILVAFVGALVILRPGFQELNSGQLAQLLAGPLFAAGFLIAKRLTADQNPMIIVCMLSFFCTLTLTPPALMTWVTPSLDQLAWLSLIAFLATAGHFTMTRAIQAAPLTVTQPIGFLQLIWAVILGIVLFDDALDPYVMIGGGIIVAAATFIGHREAVVARKAVTPPAAATKL